MFYDYNRIERDIPEIHGPNYKQLQRMEWKYET